MSKKKIIIAIVLFVFVSLTIFAFANPNEDEKLDEVKTNEVEKEKEEIEQDTLETEEDTTINRTSTVGKKNNVVLLNSKTTKSLFNKKTSDLVNALVDMVLKANSKLDLDAAREFNRVNNIVSSINKLDDKNLKNKLSNEINKILDILNDTTSPIIKIKEFVGIEPYYSQISFELYDENAIDYFTLNGVKYDRNGQMTSFVNFQDIKENIKDGENSIILYDIAGNSTEYNFLIDLVKPTIIVNDNSIMEYGIYKNISFKLEDNYLLDKFIINNEKYDLNNVKTSNVDFETIKEYLNNGNNTITLYDVAGNKTSLDFEYSNAIFVSSFDELEDAFLLGGEVRLMSDVVVTKQLV